LPTEARSAAAVDACRRANLTNDETGPGYGADFGRSVVGADAAY
jgi:hypothetical protein